ncbi:hypothetical protein DOTSEDRAFT_32047 [Dothistroma septosporum NZE10]|uniref:Uncharacterized protein n=1 Tax=Dothistroma septosporum (strain NZE10 / CBS 128990) TaxID=675120 RepID=N1PVZ1_DOTSN|nr:hypothetical protein DOTSEDRAFT_32047 [Dothistroma septosporum NZE10]
MQQTYKHHPVDAHRLCSPSLEGRRKDHAHAGTGDSRTLVAGFRERMWRDSSSVCGHAAQWAVASSRSTVIARFGLGISISVRSSPHGARAAPPCCAHHRGLINNRCLLHEHFRPRHHPHDSHGHAVDLSSKFHADPSPARHRMWPCSERQTVPERPASGTQIDIAPVGHFEGSVMILYGTTSNATFLPFGTLVSTAARLSIVTLVTNVALQNVLTSTSSSSSSTMLETSHQVPGYGAHLCRREHNKHVTGLEASDELDSTQTARLRQSRRLKPGPVKRAPPATASRSLSFPTNAALLCRIYHLTPATHRLHLSFGPPKFHNELGKKSLSGNPPSRATNQPFPSSTSSLEPTCGCTSLLERVTCILHGVSPQAFLEHRDERTNKGLGSLLAVHRSGMRTLLAPRGHPMQQWSPPADVRSSNGPVDIRPISKPPSSSQEATAARIPIDAMLCYATYSCSVCSKQSHAARERF